MEKGLVHIYCGDGKGKTTAAAGLALRCAGAGGKVLFCQFLKDGKSGEVLSLSGIDGITVVGGCADIKFVWEMTDAEKAKACEFYKTEFEKIKETAHKYNLIVLDEIIPAIECGFVSDNELTGFVKAKPYETELVMTGRNPSDTLIGLADYVTRMEKIRHPFDNGIPARKGIEW